VLNSNIVRKKVMFIFLNPEQINSLNGQSSSILLNEEYENGQVVSGTVVTTFVDTNGTTLAVLTEKGQLIPNHIDKTKPYLLILGHIRLTINDIPQYELSGQFDYDQHVFRGAVSTYKPSSSDSTPIMREYKIPEISFERRPIGNSTYFFSVKNGQPVIIKTYLLTRTGEKILSRLQETIQEENHHRFTGIDVIYFIDNTINPTGCTGHVKLSGLFEITDSENYKSKLIKGDREFFIDSEPTASTLRGEFQDCFAGQMIGASEHIVYSKNQPNQILERRIGMLNNGVLSEGKKYNYSYSSGRLPIELSIGSFSTGERPDVNNIEIDKLVDANSFLVRFPCSPGSKERVKVFLVQLSQKVVFSITALHSSNSKMLSITNGAATKLWNLSRAPDGSWMPVSKLSGATSEIIPKHEEVLRYVSDIEKLLLEERWAFPWKPTTKAASFIHNQYFEGCPAQVNEKLLGELMTRYCNSQKQTIQLAPKESSNVWTGTMSTSIPYEKNMTLVRVESGDFAQIEQENGPHYTFLNGKISVTLDKFLCIQFDGTFNPETNLFSGRLSFFKKDGGASFVIKKNQTVTSLPRDSNPLRRLLSGGIKMPVPDPNTEVEIEYYVNECLMERHIGLMREDTLYKGTKWKYDRSKNNDFAEDSIYHGNFDSQGHLEEVGGVSIFRLTRDKSWIKIITPKHSQHEQSNAVYYIHLNNNTVDSVKLVLSQLHALQHNPTMLASAWNLTRDRNSPWDPNKPREAKALELEKILCDLGWAKPYILNQKKNVSVAVATAATTASELFRDQAIERQKKAFEKARESINKPEQDARKELIRQWSSFWREPFKEWRQSLEHLEKEQAKQHQLKKAWLRKLTAARQDHVVEEKWRRVDLITEEQNHWQIIADKLAEDQKTMLCIEEEKMRTELDGEFEKGCQEIAADRFFSPRRRSGFSVDELVEILTTETPRRLNKKILPTPNQLPNLNQSPLFPYFELWPEMIPTASDSDSPPALTSSNTSQSTCNIK